MRILLVITELFEGGAENALGQVASGLFSRGIETRVVCLFGDDGAVAERLRQVGVAVDCLGLTGLQRLPRVRRLRGLVRDYRPDVVHSWLFHANLAARLAVSRAVPLVASLRVVEPRRSHVLLDRWTRGRVAKFCCVSEAVKAWSIEHLGVPAERCLVIENGVDFDSLGAARERRRSTEQLRGLCVARLTPQKGLDILLQALARLPQDLAWHWTFVGAAPDSRYAAALQQQAADLAIGDQISWLGAVPRAALPDVYGDANLYALPSRWEGQPNVLLEAMASGVPVLAAATDGTADLLAAAPGCLQPVDNEPAAWAEALIRTWSDVEAMTQLRQQGLELARRRSWAEVVAAHVALYESLLSRSEAD